MRLNQITVGCTDYAGSVAFYRRLGLTLIVDAPPRYARFETPTGETFSIHRLDTVSTTTIIYFECDDVDATVERLVLAGVRFEQMPRNESWLWREARLTDPAGNPLCLYTAGGNRRFPPWRVKPAPQL